MDNVKELIAKLNKDLGQNVIGVASEVDYTNVPRLSSGSLFLDWALGSNTKTNEAGWSLGRLVELYGYESSGKSLICLRTIVEAQKKGYLCAYIDCENTFDKAFATKIGVDCSKLIISSENNAEKVIDLAAKLLHDYPQIKVIVFDSVASMIPATELEHTMEESKGMAALARVLSPGLRKLIAMNKNNALLLFINQIRLNPGAGMYANPEYQPGGQSLKFYSSIRAEIRRGDWIFGEDEEKKVKKGQVVKFKIVKNKSGIPHKEGYFKFMYETASLDEVDELVSLALLEGKIGRSGAYYSFGDNHTFQGREKMEDALRTDETLFAELQKEVFEKEVKDNGK